MNDPMSAKRNTFGMLLAAASIFCPDNAYSYESSVIKTKKDLRPCLYCGTLHDHNNSFCSPECCKAWNAERKEVM
jgi:hypothetical protein